MLIIGVLFYSERSWAQPDDTTAVPAIIEGVKEEDTYDMQDDDEDEKKPVFIRRDAEGFQQELTPRRIPAGKIKELKEKKAFWYADAEFKEDEPVVAEDPLVDRYVPLGQREWFKTLLWIVIVGAFMAVLMIYLTNNNVGLFRRKSKVLIDPDEEMTETTDIFSINYQKEIEKAAANGNYRLAIRLMFLKLLKQLSDKQIIHYTQDKTNFDYLLQVHPTPYYKNFFRITRHYEYSWYGHFDVNEQTYRLIRNDVDEFEREIK